MQQGPPSCQTSDTLFDSNSGSTIHRPRRFANSQLPPCCFRGPAGQHLRCAPPPIPKCRCLRVFRLPFGGIKPREASRRAFPGNPRGDVEEAVLPKAARECCHPGKVPVRLIGTAECFRLGNRRLGQQPIWVEGLGILVWCRAGDVLPVRLRQTTEWVLQFHFSHHLGLHPQELHQSGLVPEGLGDGDSGRSGTGAAASEASHLCGIGRLGLVGVTVATLARHDGEIDPR
ncbi:hypothetical protein V8F20_001178 [Naviculisporaceae sp. PSN 640]